MSDLWAVVPVKCFARGKSRLESVLPCAAREELARTLCEHALDVLAASGEISGIVVATDCAAVGRLASARGAEIVRDASPGPLARVIDRALGVLASRGARAALVLMSDLPLLAPDDIRSLVAAMKEAPMVLAPDRVDAGTNALGLTPPDLIATCFGSESSFEDHRARALAAGIPVAVHRGEGTARDLDSPEDFASLCDYAEGARFRWKRNRSSRERAA